MVSSQKIILTLIFMNIIILGSVNVYENAEDQTLINAIDKYYDQADEDQARNLEDDTAGWFNRMVSGAQAFFEDAWDTIAIAGTIIKLFIQGLLPWQISFQTAEGGETMLKMGLRFFRMLFIFLVMLEAYMIYKNRKTS